MTRKIAFGLALGGLLTMLTACGNPRHPRSDWRPVGRGHRCRRGRGDPWQAGDWSADRRRRRCGRRRGDGARFCAKE